MQTLYASDSMGNTLSATQAQQILKKNLEQSQQLFTYLVYFLTEIAGFAEADALQKAHKHLPSHNDLNVNTKISGNDIIWAALENKSLTSAIKIHHIENLIDKELVRRIYLLLIASDEYKTYIALQSRDKRSEKKILEYIFNDLMLANNDFTSNIEEYFINWDDDADMMVLLMANFMQSPVAFNFGQMLSEEKGQFGINLLSTVIEKKEVTLDLIKPKLKNWDAERIAALDMVMMHMGVCEFLYFETIPPKVTINEYIDLAKEYSTPQSGHFVNGILDNIHKELLADNKLQKKNFKNSTL